MIGASIDRLIDWLSIRSIVWLIDWLIDWLMAHLFGRWIDWLTAWLIDCLFVCFIDWLIVWLDVRWTDGVLYYRAEREFRTGRKWRSGRRVYISERVPCRRVSCPTISGRANYSSTPTTRWNLSNCPIGCSRRATVSYFTATAAGSSRSPANPASCISANGRSNCRPRSSRSITLWPRKVQLNRGKGHLWHLGGGGRAYWINPSCTLFFFLYFFRAVSPCGAGGILRLLLGPQAPPQTRLEWETSGEGLLFFLKHSHFL